jgi:hypothetical protein
LQFALKWTLIPSLFFPRFWNSSILGVLLKISTTWHMDWL